MEGPTKKEKVQLEKIEKISCLINHFCRRNKWAILGITTIIIIFGLFQLSSIEHEKQPTIENKDIVSGNEEKSSSDKTEKQIEIVKKDTISSWDPETASFIEYASYDEMEQKWENERKIEVEEYKKATTETIVEQVQNIEIPSYDNESDLAQLQQGEIEVRGEKWEDFPDGVLLWFASLEENVNSFTVDDFNNDGLDDVAHVIVYTGGGSGMFYNLIIFMNNQGKLKYLAHKDLGDRVVIKSVKYNSGEFVINLITQGEGDNFIVYCCPNVPETIKLRLENNKLIEI